MLGKLIDRLLGKPKELVVTKTKESCPDNAVCAYEYKGKLYKSQAEIDKVKADQRLDKARSVLRSRLMIGVEYGAYSFNPFGPRRVYTQFLRDRLNEDEDIRRLVNSIVNNPLAFFEDLEELKDATIKINNRSPHA